MLRTVYLKSLRDRWIGVLVGVFSLFATAVLGLWAYSGVEGADTYLNSLPEAYANLLGITPDAGTTGLMFSTLFSFMGPLVLAGLAISIGASSIAGEERDGTMNLLATAPRSRARLFASKALALLTLVVAANAVLLASYWLAVAITGSDPGSLDLIAATVHVTVVTLLYGALALALGAATGNRGTASGIPTGFLIVSFLGAGLLPMFSGWEAVAKIFPWYYIDAAAPMLNGVDWAQVAALLAISGALAAGGWWGFSRRDIRTGGGASSMLDRLRTSPRMAAMIDRVQGNGATTSMFAKSLSDKRGLALLGAYGLLVLTIFMGPMFNALGDSIGEVVDSMPDAVLAMVGFADYSTPTGWYHGEVLSITSPAVFAIVAVAAGAALAAEERRHTIAVLLSAPVARSRLAHAKLWAMVALTALCGLLLFGGIAIANWISDLEMGVANIAAAAALQAALGLVFGAAAFAAGGAIGTSSAAVWTGTGVAVVGWGINTFVGVNPDLENVAKVSPFYWALHSYPLDNGMDWLGLTVLLVAAAVLCAVGVILYGRRDLRG